MSFPVVPLGDIATIIMGQSPPSNTYNEYGVGLPFFQGKADFGENHPTVRKWCVAPNKIAESGDILISVRAPVGPTNIADTKCCVGRGLAAVRPNETLALRDFVLWSLKHHQTDLIELGQGSTFVAIGKETLKSLQIPLPTLDEQRRIVDILNRAAKIERLRRQAQERLREFIPALFIKMFGDPVENPMGWEIRQLGNLIQGFQGGRNVQAGNGASKFRILKVSAVTDGIFNPSESKPAPNDYVPPIEHIVRPGDLLISRANTSDLVGASAIVEDRSQFLLLPDKIWRIVWQANSSVDPIYLHNYLKSSSTRAMLSAMATGTSGSMKNISQAKLKTLPILVPPIDLQQQFTNVVNTVRTAGSIARTGSKYVSDLNASLMFRLLRDGV